jgi:hypothetical protein
MTGINRTTRVAASIFLTLALAACGAIPTAEEYTLEKHGGVVAADGTAMQTAASESGLGTINKYGETTVKCKRKRSTGSNIGWSSCRKADSGSQPVRDVPYSTPAPVINPGASRPN